jgi:thiol-disulfide isomerase/thioredoxin
MHVRSAAGGAIAAAIVCFGVSTGLAQSAFAIGKSSAYRVVVPAFTDPQVTQLVATLDKLLAAPDASKAWGDSAKATLTDFGRRIQMGRLTAPQESLVLEHLAGIDRAHPDEAPAKAARHTVSSLTVGKVAPEIEGRDLEGAPLKLSDLKGKVVVLVFWGQWCGICRTQYPYERLLLELYKNWPFAIVGVNSDRTREIAQQAVTDNRLGYRSWWDGPADDRKSGPIADAWNVSGWPMVYVLDEQGVIRFIDLGQEDLLKAVRQLFDERK